VGYYPNILSYPVLNIEKVAYLVLLIVKSIIEISSEKVKSVKSGDYVLLIHVNEVANTIGGL